MKPIICCCLALCCCVGVVGCGQESAPANSSQPAAGEAKFK